MIIIIVHFDNRLVTILSMFKFCSKHTHTHIHTTKRRIVELSVSVGGGQFSIVCTG